MHFTKYQALGNDFLVVDTSRSRVPSRRRSEFVVEICRRRTGVGGDGVLFLSKSRRADAKVEIVNGDGSPAEKSGNGLRSIAMHLWLKNKRRKTLSLEMNRELHKVDILEGNTSLANIRTDLGKPEFEAAKVPVKTDARTLLNSPLKLEGGKIPVTCLAIGNPHTVLIVDDFDFNWQELGAEIEKDKVFPNQTNVEFVKAVSRRKLRVADWERGAGATGSSGTGAAAAVCAGVMAGFADRQCQVQFERGSLFVHWNPDTDHIELTGPVGRVAEGEFTFV